ncbi:hypothetical protein [Nitrosomonas sp. ANs5]|uniref:hypothetical protein n=1 Tax=Nitrosomonas sp. ANs5 TaxID=3423941 RepID=UPI003D34781E
MNGSECMCGGHFLLSHLCERSEAIQPNVNLTLMSNTSPGRQQPLGFALDGAQAHPADKR